ncbi:hypothetical protein EB118_17820 [bacterium]|nr:hypothetical protein [bacterium]
MKIRKLDRRHNGHGYFKYYVQFSYIEPQKFIEHRNWCWQTWGPSCELEFYPTLPIKPKWAWVKDQYNIRLYLETDSEYAWYGLKWK